MGINLSQDNLNKRHNMYIYKTNKEKALEINPNLICKTIRIRKDLYYYIVDTQTEARLPACSALTGNDAWKYANKQLLKG
jgi:hypothetical protein